MNAKEVMAELVAIKARAARYDARGTGVGVVDAEGNYRITPTNAGTAAFDRAWLVWLLDRTLAGGSELSGDRVAPPRVRGVDSSS